MLETIDTLQLKNNELMTRQLRDCLLEQWPSLKVLISAIKRAHKEKRWVCTMPHYCQLIHEVNKIKQKEWCQQQINNQEQFKNVIFTDWNSTADFDSEGNSIFEF